MLQQITPRIISVGVDDPNADLFEEQFVLNHGMSYNSYAILADRIAVMDSVEAGHGEMWMENILTATSGRQPDYLVVHHMEPDHSACILAAMERWPGMTLVGSQQAIGMLGGFFPGADFCGRTKAVREGDTLDLGGAVLRFYAAPMVHWPEVMVSVEQESRVLFSADAFGKFGSLQYADEWVNEARRYYFNIVGKYGSQVQALLKKAASLEIQMLCPLHGPILRENIGWFLDKYMHWSSYTPEESAVMIAYGSVYGNTEAAAFLLASRLAERGVRNVLLYDVSVTHPSLLVAEAFRCSHLIFASATYNAGIFPCMETLLLELKAHSLKNRTVGLLDNGTWAATAGNQMRTVLESMQNMTILEPVIHIKSALTEAQLPELDALADAVAASL